MVLVLFLIWMYGVLGYQGIPPYAPDPAEAAAQVQSYNIRLWQRQTADRLVRHYSNDEDMLKRNAGVEQSSNQNQNQPASTTSQPVADSSSARALRWWNHTCSTHNTSSVGCSATMSSYLGVVRRLRDRTPGDILHTNSLAQDLGRVH